MRFINYCMVVSCLLLPASVFAVNPAEKFDFRYWKLNVPEDVDKNGKVDEIKVDGMEKYSHPDFFYLDPDGLLVFAAPNKAMTTSGSSNARSELRQMLRGKNTKLDDKGPKNHFTLKANQKAKTYGAVGGQLEATLKVMHVSENAKYPAKKPSYSVVVGQIHALKQEKVIEQGQGFGYGNEPIKIYYKKLPEHATGSVFWTYERNLPKEDPARTDIAYPIWGNTWENLDDPGESGIALGQLFKYKINVHGNVMYLTFQTTDPTQTVKYQIDLSNNVDANGNVDEKDHLKGYSGDALYFKAGAYNQCSTKDAPGFWYAGCAGTGDWDIDKANGDYVEVAFRRIQLSRSVEPGK